MSRCYFSKNKIICRGLAFFFAAAVFGMSGTVVLAGSINSDEARVISAASGTFTYNGEGYRVQSSYISQLKAYLASDDVDLTAAQADKAIAKLYDSLEEGVGSGYFYKVTPDNTQATDEETAKENTEAGAKEVTTEEDTEAGTEEGTAEENTEAEAEEVTTEEDAEAETEEEVEEIDTKSEAQSKTESYAVEVLEQPSEDDITGRLYYNEDTGVMTWYNAAGDETYILPSADAPWDVSSYSHAMQIVLSIMLAVIVILLAVLIMGKCFPWQRKRRKRNEGKYYVDHRLRRRLRCIAGNVMLVLLALHICALLMIAGVRVSLFNSHFVQDHLSSSGYYRYIYEEFKEEAVSGLEEYDDAAVDTLLDQLTYERFLSICKMRLEESLTGETAAWDGTTLRNILEDSIADSSLSTEGQSQVVDAVMEKVESSTADVIGASIYGIRKGFLDIVKSTLVLMIINVLFMIAILVTMDRYLHRGIRYISRAVIGGAGIVILTCAWLLLIKQYSSIYMEPAYLSLFVVDYLKRSLLVILSIAVIGALLGMGLRLSVDTIRKRQLDRE